VWAHGLKIDKNAHGIHRTRSALNLGKDSNMHLKHLKIGQRLALAFGLILVLLAVVLVTGVRKLQAMDDLLVNIVEGNGARIDAASTMRDSLRRISIAMRDMTITTDDAQMQEQAKIIATARDTYDKAETALERLHTSDEGKAVHATIVASRNATLPLIAQGETLAQANDLEGAGTFLRTQFVPAMRPWTAAIDEMVDLQQARNVRDQASGHESYAQARVLMFSVGGFAFVASILVAWLITRPLNRAVEVARTVAAGDLSSDIAVDSTDETGQLLTALKDMNANLRTIVGKVRDGTETIATASDEIASGNLDLSARTEQQASSLEETASSMEELTSTVKQNAENARQANTLARSASDVATRGGAVVADVVDTMSAIHASASKIVDIISVIDGIAFQTNILALNAAVEAARAGEQGRGFAVVASEVRSLAQRSASAAKEIKTLIDDSVTKVDEGSRLVTQAGSTMSEIVGSVKRVTDIMGEITVASAEQESGIEQINQAISEMDAVTQQNAALVEEAAAAAESLKEQSAQLAATVSVFNVGDAGSPPAGAPRGVVKQRALTLRAA
jgi:methyl-accepting chemotaxis protein